jgi:membrane dipeptidase
MLMEHPRRASQLRWYASGFMKRLRWILLLLVMILVAAWFAFPGIVERRFNRTLHPPPYQPSAQAQALHRTLTVADLHGDSLLWGRSLLRRSNRGHIDLPRLIDGNISIQAFTVVTTAPRKLNIFQNSDSTDQVRNIAIFEGWPPRTWNSPKQRALYQAARLQKFADQAKGALVIVRSRADLQKFLTTRGSTHAVAGFLGAEGAQPLEGNLANLEELYAAGFRMMAPTHFTDTAIAGAAAGMKKDGLTDLGREWVHAMESHHMLIDLAHASPATLRDVTAMATRPLIVSHTGVKGTCNNPRNLSEDELRAVAQTNGVIGIGLWDTATCGTDARAAARAIHYALNIVGADHVALGSDFDGGITAPFDSSGWALLTDALLQEGISEQDIHKIMGENVVRVLLEVLP